MSLNTRNLWLFSQVSPSCASNMFLNLLFLRFSNLSCFQICFFIIPNFDLLMIPFGHILLHGSFEGILSVLTPTVWLFPQFLNQIPRSKNLTGRADYTRPHQKIQRAYKSSVYSNQVPTVGSPRIVKPETWLSRNALSFQRKRVRCAGRQSLYSSGTRIDKASAFCILGDSLFFLHLKGLVIVPPEENMESFWCSPSSTVIYEFAIFRSRLVIPEVSAQVLRSWGLKFTTFVLSHACPSRFWEEVAQKYALREKKRSTLVINCHTAKLSLLFFFSKHLYWGIIALQCCVSFCYITKWVSYTYTYIPISPPSCVSLPPTLPIPPI